jgi:hypothetical protein
MDVSDITRQLSSGAGAALAVAVRPPAADPAEDAPSRRADVAVARPDHRVDPLEAYAERAKAGIDRASPSAPAPPDAAIDERAKDVWIPAWVRAQYASRARKGWFLPPLTLLAGYGDGEDLPPGD